MFRNCKFTGFARMNGWLSSNPSLECLPIGLCQPKRWNVWEQTVDCCFLSGCGWWCAGDACQPVNIVPESLINLLNRPCQLNVVRCGYSSNWRGLGFVSEEHLKSIKEVSQMIFLNDCLLKNGTSPPPINRDYEWMRHFHSNANNPLLLRGKLRCPRTTIVDLVYGSSPVKNNTTFLFPPTPNECHSIFNGSPEEEL